MYRQKADHLRTLNWRWTLCHITVVPFSWVLEWLRNSGREEPSSGENLFYSKEKQTNNNNKIQFCTFTLRNNDIHVCHVTAFLLFIHISFITYFENHKSISGYLGYIVHSKVFINSTLHHGGWMHKVIHKVWLCLPFTKLIVPNLNLALHVELENNKIIISYLRNSTLF